MCFRYEKQRSNFASYLERAESASKPDSQHLSADKVKLHTEIHDMQVCYSQSRASFFPDLAKQDYNRHFLFRLYTLKSSHWSLLYQHFLLWSCPCVRRHLKIE